MLARSRIGLPFGAERCVPRCASRPPPPRGLGNQEDHVAHDPHDRSGAPLVGQGVDAVRRAECRVMGVERARGEQDGHRQERVLWHLEEDVAHSGRIAHPVRGGIHSDDRPPEQQAGQEEQDVLEVVDQGILERQLEQRREVRAPHHPCEDQPGDDGMAQECQDPAAVQDREDHPLACLWGGRPQELRHRRPERKERWSDERQDDVLDHVDREEGRVIPGNPGQQGEGNARQAGQEREPSAIRNPVTGMSAIDRAEQHYPDDRGHEQRKGDGRLEVPAKEELWPRRRVGIGRARARDRSKQGAHGHCNWYADEAAGDRGEAHRRHVPTLRRRASEDPGPRVSCRPARPSGWLGRAPAGGSVPLRHRRTPSLTLRTADVE